MKTQKVKKKLHRLGWATLRKTGSHLILTKEGITITLPEHHGKDVNQELIRRLAKTNDMTLAQFKSF